jgi:hypothetical protein
MSYDKDTCLHYEKCNNRVEHLSPCSSPTANVHIACLTLSATVLRHVPMQDLKSSINSPTTANTANPFVCVCVCVCACVVCV